MMGRLAFLFGSLDPFGNPPPEILHGIAADAKFDQMKRHVLMSAPTLMRLTFATGPAAGSSSECQKTAVPAGDQSEETEGAGAAGAREVAGAGAGGWRGFGAGCFLAAATVGDAGRGDDDVVDVPVEGAG